MKKIQRKTLELQVNSLKEIVAHVCGRIAKLSERPTVRCIFRQFAAVFNESRTEVDEQAESVIEELAIRQYLLCMDWMYALNRFQFHDNAVFNDQIGSETFVE